MNTCIFCEANGEGGSENFLLKEILLVEEEDDGGVTKPLVVADGVEQLQALLHPVLNRRKTSKKLNFNTFFWVFDNL